MHSRRDGGLPKRGGNPPQYGLWCGRPPRRSVPPCRKARIRCVRAFPARHRQRSLHGALRRDMGGREARRRRRQRALSSTKARCTWRSSRSRTRTRSRGSAHGDDRRSTPACGTTSSGVHTLLLFRSALRRRRHSPLFYLASIDTGLPRVQRQEAHGLLPVLEGIGHLGRGEWCCPQCHLLIGSGGDHRLHVPSLLFVLTRARNVLHCFLATLFPRRTWQGPGTSTREGCGATSIVRSAWASVREDKECPDRALH